MTQETLEEAAYRLSAEKFEPKHIAFMLGVIEGAKWQQERLKETLKIDLTNLCYYDKRNPDCSVDDEDIEDHKKSLLKKNKTCSCDNCFYGRAELAEQIIWQQERMYSEEEVGNIANWAFGFYKRNDLSDSELEDEFNRILVEQFKKK